MFTPLTKVGFISILSRTMILSRCAIRDHLMYCGKLSNLTLVFFLFLLSILTPTFPKGVDLCMLFNVLLLIEFFKCSTHVLPH